MRDDKVNVMLYRARLSLTSGAGQLIRMQAQGLRDAGAAVRIAGQRGLLKYRLLTGMPVSRLTAERARRLAARPGRDSLIVDHGAAIESADVTFVHNLHSAVNAYLRRPDWAAEAAEETRLFGALRKDTPIVANSQLVRSALLDRFGFDPGRVLVHYPGYRADVFSAAAAADLRARARRKLGLDDATPLIGLVTSGDFRKRGLDIFLSAAAQIAAAWPEARFLVVGSKHLPDEARGDALVRTGRVAYRPKSRDPRPWMAALDVFLYTARFEEFGMVVAEAQALGVPVVTSRRVGAAECLPDVYADWVVDEPLADAFAANALALLADEPLRRRLAAAALASVQAYAEAHYASATARTILDQKR